MDDYVSLWIAEHHISHHEPRFVLGREMRPPIFTLFAAKLQTPKIAQIFTLYYLTVIMNLDKILLASTKVILEWKAFKVLVMIT